MRQLLNSLRNIWLFKVRYPWVKIGRNVHCQASTRFWSPHRRIILGDNVGIGWDCDFSCDTEIGSKVLIASRVSFLNGLEHRYDIVGKTIWDSGRGQDYPILIEDDVWLGYRATLLAPLKVGRGSIVAAGAVVVRDVAPYSIVGGVPARLLKMRFSNEEVIAHEKRLREIGELPPDAGKRFTEFSDPLQRSR